MLEPAIVILALLLLTIGSWLAWTPLGLIVPGVLLLCGVICKRVWSIPKAEQSEET